MEDGLEAGLAETTWDLIYAHHNNLITLGNPEAKMVVSNSQWIYMMPVSF